MTFDDARPSASDRLLLIEAWINIFLSTNHIVLGFFHCVRKVDRPTRVIIIVASLIDLASMVMICMGALDQVAYFNQAHTIYSWYIEVSSLLTQLSGFIEQGVFLRRYWQYTREPSASLVIWLLMLGRIIICATLTGMILSRGIAAIRFANVATITIAVLSAFTDICLMLLLTWRIRGLKVIYNSSQTLPRDIILYATTNGCISAMSTLLLLIMLFVNYYAYHFIYFTLGRIYTLTTVITLVVARESFWKPQHSRSNHFNCPGSSEIIGSPTMHTHPMSASQFTDITHRLGLDDDSQEAVNRSIVFSSKRSSFVSISSRSLEGS